MQLIKERGAAEDVRDYEAGNLEKKTINYFLTLPSGGFFCLSQQTYN